MSEPVKNQNGDVEPPALLSPSGFAIKFFNPINNGNKKIQLIDHFSIKNFFKLKWFVFSF